MNKKIALLVAGIVFSLVALGHLLRIILMPVITINNYIVPITFNYVGLAISLALAIWMFASCCCCSKK